MSVDPGVGRTAPSPAELAAIVAAVEVAWPRPVVVAEASPPRRPWRWSGRWWASGMPSAAERGYVDDVIDPADTRAILARSLEMLRSKREDLPKRKHGNVPL